MRLDLDWFITGTCIGTYAIFLVLGGTAFLRSPAFIFITLMSVAIFLIQFRNDDGERVLWPSAVAGCLGFAYLVLL